MLTSYEQHLYEILEKTQEELKKAIDSNNSLNSKNKEIEEERNNFRDYWFEYSAKASKLEKQLEELLNEKEEQDALTSNSSDDSIITLKEAI